MATFRKRGGKWQVQVRREGQPALSRTFVYRKDAQAWARDIEAKQERGFAAVDNRALRSSTVDDLLERYVRTITIAKRGRGPETTRIGRMRRSAVASLSLAATTPDKFAEYRDHRLTEVAPATVRKEMALFHHMFRIPDTRRRYELTKAVRDLRLWCPGQSVENAAGRVVIGKNVQLVVVEFVGKVMRFPAQSLYDLCITRNHRREMLCNQCAIERKILFHRGRQMRICSLFLADLVLLFRLNKQRVEAELAGRR